MSAILSDSELYEFLTVALNLIDGHNRAVHYIQPGQEAMTREFFRSFGMEHYVKIMEDDTATFLIALMVASNSEPLSSSPEIRQLLSGFDTQAFVDKVKEVLKHFERSTPPFNEVATIDRDSELKPEDLLAIMAARSIILNFAASFHFDRRLPQIIRAAREGSKNDIITLVKLDASFLGAEFVRSELLLAELTHDHHFKRRLSNALTPDPKGRKYQSKRLRFVLTVLYTYGFRDKTDDQWADFLSKFSSLKSLHQTANVTRYRQRYELLKQEPRKKRSSDNTKT